MNRSLLTTIVLASLLACNNKKENKSFCDGNCGTNELSFKGDDKFQQTAVLKLKDCVGDSIIWTHGQTINTRKTQITELMNGPIKMNKSAMSFGFQDTTALWFAFNDCATSRGYLLKLPYNEKGGIVKYSGALNSFDPKFNIDPDLRAYTDRGNLYAVNIVTGKDTQMTFKKEYPMDFTNVHKNVDTVSVTKNKLYIRLLDEDGKVKEFEKKIAL